MELSACIAAMVWVKENGIRQRYDRVQVFSDSQYVVNNQSSAPYWQRDKWRNAAGRPIENSDLWKQFLLLKAKAGIRIDICKVLNKSTPLLKLVDKLAKTAAKSHSRVDRGLVVGKIGRAKIKGTPTMFPATNQVLVARIVRSNTIGPSHENKFVFEVFDESTKTYVSKYFAYCNSAVGAELHRQRGFRVRMNGNPKYPQILEVLEEVALPKAERKKRSMTQTDANRLVHSLTFPSPLSAHALRLDFRESSRRLETHHAEPLHVCWGNAICRSSSGIFFMRISESTEKAS
jgi:ribonuclease HI